MHSRFQQGQLRSSHEKVPARLDYSHQILGRFVLQDVSEQHVKCMREAPAGRHYIASARCWAVLLKQELMLT